ncbi:hypothetical protein BH09ACT3_BH09ACT3_14150 [soil metagenome]
MSWILFGLPLHPLFVHGAVVAIPVVALLAIAAAWLSRVKDWLGVVLPVLASLALVGVLLANETGEALEAQVPKTAAVAAHSDIADIAVAGGVLLFLIIWAQWLWEHFFVQVRPGRSQARVTDARTARGVAIAISVAQTLIALFAIVAVTIVGDTGARAVWQ